MRKFYSIVLMATALLIGTNVMADEVTIGTTGAQYTDLQTAINEAPAEGRTIKLITPLTLQANDQGTWAGVWVGTVDENGDAKSITLDLAGNNITVQAGKTSQNVCPFVITKGKLEIKSDTKAKISVVPGPYSLNKNTSVFSVFGTFNRVDPKGATPFSHLLIGENVIVETQNGTGIIVDQLNSSQTAISALATKPNYRTDYYKTKPNAKGKTSARGFAFGALVEVKGQLISQGGTKCYGIKTNGNLACPGDTALDKSGYAGISPEISAADRKYAPYIHVYPSAKLESEKNYLADGCAAAYASGYAQWKIEGACEGATGVYASSGNIAIEGEATITSTCPTHVEPTDAGHANGAGSAIVVNSRDAYAGAMDVTISGDPNITSTAGYALEESVKTSNDTTKVENITINGGTFQGGTDPVTHEDKPAIIVSNTTASNETTEVVVYGGNVVNGAEVGQTGTLDDLIPTTVHTTTMEVDGKQVTVVSEGAAPVAANSVIAATPNTSVKWQNTTTKEETLNADLNLAELEINETYAQKLTIAEGKTLNVGRVVLGPNAQIIVEAGAKFIVNGEQGFVAPVASNIVMKNEDGKRSILLFNPAVTSNKHPNATVELITNSWRNSASDLQWEILGLPTNEIVTSIDREGTAPVAISVWENGSWSSLGIIGQDVIDVTKLNKPFAPYDLLANRAKDAAAPKIIIKGQLVGNIAGSLNATHRWTPFANSYTGELDLKAYLTALGGAHNIAQGIWVATRSGNGHLAWDPVDLQGVFDGDAEVLKLAPMQAFMLNNPGTSIEASALDYGSMVWAPATSTQNPAPRRMTASETTAKARVIVTNEQGIVDKVMLRENANNVYALEKYMNEDMNIYVQADEKSAIVNAENMENMYVGFSTVNGGTFTINFANVAGREFVLVDHETGAQVAIAEGNTYEFTAAANSTNDYRFEIVEPAKLPTAIENAEAVKSAKGIYTITGQYVGEMSVWNSLPAGIYVVNGEKLVK